MRNNKREIECLIRLHSLGSVYEELLKFLLDELLINKEELNVIRASPEQGKLLQQKLSHLSQESKIQLLEYEWTILPVERIRLTLVTNRGHKELVAEV